MKGSMAALTTLVAASVLSFAPLARAAPPSLDSVGQASRRITASWTLPPGMLTYSIEISKSGETQPDGENKGSYIGTPGLMVLELLTKTSYASWQIFPGGTYYVHVAAWDTTKCSSMYTCEKEFSSSLPVVVPAPDPPELISVAQSARELIPSFVLQPDTDFASLEVATSPEVYADGPSKGAFLDENRILPDPGADLSYQSRVPLPGGTYYVHVGAFDSAFCAIETDQFCTVQYSSPPSVVVIPSDAPTLTTGDQTSHHLRVAWALPPDASNDFIEIATSPAVYPDGPLKGLFLDENTVLFDDSLAATQQTYFTIDRFPPGTYYAHVADYAPASCPTPDARTCFDELSAPLEIVIPPDPVPVTPDQVPVTPALAPAPPAARDTAVAFKTVSVRSRQFVRSLYVEASMAEPGTISAGGTVAVPSASQIYKLEPVSAVVAAGVAVKLRLRLPHKARRAVRDALKRRKRVRAKITITARDRAGNTKIESRTVDLEDRRNH